MQSTNKVELNPKLNRNKSLSKVFDRVIQGMFFLFIALILSVLLFSNENHIMRQNFILPNYLLLIIGLGFTGILLFLNSKIKINIDVNINKLTFILFLLVSYISFNIAAEFNWDNYTVLHNAQLIAGGAESKYLDSEYFSIYHNNMLLLMIYTLIFKLHKIFGIFVNYNNYMPIILVQCALMSMSAKVLYNIVFDLTKSQKASLLSFLIFSLSVVLSGWSVVTYSDQIGMIFTLLILRQYQLISQSKHSIINILLIVLFSFIAFKLKPTLLIPTIAIIIYEIIHGALKFNLKTLKIILSCLLLIVILFGGYSLVKARFITYSGMEIDDSKAFSAWHYIMMGLNKETEGTFSKPDCDFSKSLAKEIRSSGQKSEIKSRLSDLNILGMINHIEKKALNSFNDGSFFWNQKAYFIKNEFELPNNHVAPFLQSIYYNKYSEYKITFNHLIWVATLFLSIFSVFFRKNNIVSTILISIIGYIMFVMIFEAGPRYLINFISYFIILTALVLQNVQHKINAKSVSCFVGAIHLASIVLWLRCLV